MPEDPDADVMELKVSEVGNVVFYGGMALVTLRFGVEKYPAAFGGVINGIRVTTDKVIEGRIKRDKRALIRGNCAHQSQTTWVLPEYTLEFPFVFGDHPEHRHGGIQASLAHFTRVSDR
jgi:hypothetical protein